LPKKDVGNLAAIIADKGGSHLPFSRKFRHHRHYEADKIMRITGNNPVTGVQGRSSKKRASGAGQSFVPDAGAETPQSAATTSGGPIQGIDALLALQEVDDVSERRSRATRRGHAMLDSLEELKADLLTGRVSEDRLHKLASELDGKEDSGDPAVNEVLEEIELRVKVELAKLGRFS